AESYLGIQPKCFNIDTKKLLLGNISIPVNKRCEMFIQNATQKITNYSMLDVVQSIKAIKNGKKPLISPSSFKDKIVLIGITTSGSAEFCSTPFSNIELMLHVHSNIVNTILNKRFITEIPLWIYGLIVLCCGLIAGLCCFLIASLVSRILLIAGLMIAYGLSAFLSLKYMDLQINILAPVLTIFLSSVLVIIYQYLLEKRDLILSLTRMTSFNENILTSMSSGLIVIDSAQRVKKINHVAMNILGFEKEADVIGKDILPARLLQVISNDMETKEVIKKRTILLGDKNLEINVSHLKNNSKKAQGAVILIDDITKIMELEEQARLNERLADIGILASKISHEIGNSLTVILLFADYLNEILAGQGQQIELVKEIIKEANMLAKKTSALKNYARPVTLELQKTDVNQMLETVLRKISKEVKSNNIEVKKNLRVDLPLIMLDIDHMEGAFLNLVINAIHAMSSGGMLTVGTDIAALDGCKKVEIIIRDTGSGISPDIQGKVFNPFFTTKKQEGTGLGLSIVHKIISSHKGTVSFETEEGKGTTFIVRLPVDEEQW
ncbi:MAG: ATP-binding protein, partial [Candidatus Desantisbacteria bacterium]